MSQPPSRRVPRSAPQGPRRRHQRVHPSRLADAANMQATPPSRNLDRYRLLASGATNKNDPNGARSVAIAALRSATRREVKPDDHAAVLKVWSKRHRDLGRARNQFACRLHALLCELVPGGIAKEITAAQATHLLERTGASSAVELARYSKPICVKRSFVCLGVSFRPDVSLALGSES
jgi:hypothetical protein